MAYNKTHPPINRGFFTGEFVRALKKSNPGVDCFGHTDQRNPASIFYKDEQICAIPKGFVPVKNAWVSVPTQGFRVRDKMVAKSWWNILQRLAGKKIVKIDVVLKALRKL